MPRQNRVTPFGDIIAIPERGTFLGNRGVLTVAVAPLTLAAVTRAPRWLGAVEPALGSTDLAHGEKI